MTTPSPGLHVHLFAMTRPSSSPNNLNFATLTVIESVCLIKTHALHSPVQFMKRAQSSRLKSR